MADRFEATRVVVWLEMVRPRSLATMAWSRPSSWFAAAASGPGSQRPQLGVDCTLVSRACNLGECCCLGTLLSGGVWPVTEYRRCSGGIGAMSAVAAGQEGGQGLRRFSAGAGDSMRWQAIRGLSFDGRCRFTVLGLGASEGLRGWADANTLSIAERVYSGVFAGSGKWRAEALREEREREQGAKRVDEHLEIFLYVKSEGEKGARSRPV